MGYDVFVYLSYVAVLTLCASRSPRLAVVRARFRIRARDRVRATAGRPRDLPT